MLITVAGWALCLAIGIALQRRLRDPQRASHVLFLAVLWVIAPLAVIYAYTTVAIEATLLAAFAAAIAASWLTLLIGIVWARLGGRDRREAGVLAIATGMGNTGNLGYPLSTVAYGGPGLSLAVIYSEFQYLIPLEAVILGLGRHYAGPKSRGARATGVRNILKSWLFNPPMAASVAAIALRVAGVDISGLVRPLGETMGILVGIVGFVQLGLAIPLGPVVHDRADLWRASVTICLRCVAAPLILFALGAALGVDIPGALLLMAAMPVAFNTLVISAVFDLDAELARLLVAVSTPLMVAGFLVWQMAT